MVNNMNTEKYIFPKDIDMASTLLKGPKTLLISGGTSFGFRNLERYSSFIDISRIISGDIEMGEDKFHFGAMCRMRDIIDNRELANINRGIFRTCASNMGTTALRNQITLGGNITMVYRWSDMPVVLLCLNAHINTMENHLHRTYSAMDFFRKQPIGALNKGELVTRIDVPILKEHKLTFDTFRKTMGDFAGINIATGYLPERNFNDVRIAISAISSMPLRLVKLEQWLQGKVRSKKTLASGMDVCLPTMGGSDFRYSASFLNKVVRVMIQRALFPEKKNDPEEVSE